MLKPNCQKLAKNIIIFTGIILLSFFFFNVNNVFANSTNVINFQGKIVRNDSGYEGLNVTAGNPSCVVAGVSNDTCDFRARYYSAASGGTLFLTEVFSNKEIGQYNGAFNLSLGSDPSPTAGTYSSLNALVEAQDTVYVEIGFDPAGGGSYTETFTRMPLEATAYAIRSKYASNASTAFQFDTAVNATGYSTPSAGMVYFDTTDTTLKVYDGATWVDIGSGGSGSSPWTDDGLFSYLTDLTDSLVLGSSTYTAIGTDTYATYTAGLASKPSLSFDMGAERLTLSGSTARSGLSVYSNYASTSAWPLVLFKAEDSGFDNVVLEIVQDGTGHLMSLKKGSTEVFAFENEMTFFVRPRDTAPGTSANRLYNVGGTLYWNGTALATGSSSLWTDGSTYTYLTSTTDDLVLGGNTPGTSKFFFDMTNGRLGIGTSAPTAKIDIAGATSTISNSSGDITISPEESLVIKAQNTNGDNLMEWQNSSGTVLGLINSTGFVSFGRSTGNSSSILSLGAGTTSRAQINLTTSGGIDVSSPNSGDLWWNGTNLYFFDGTNSVDILVGSGGDSAYGSVANGGYLNVQHDSGSYNILADGWVCVGGANDAHCTGGNWKNIKDTDTTIGHYLSNQWNKADPDGIIRSQVRLTDVELSPGIDVGTGADGDITVSSDTNINTTQLISGRYSGCPDAVNYNVTAFNVAGTEATLSTSPDTAHECLKEGDEVLIINLQGTYTAIDNVGNYETLEVSSVSGTTVTFKTAKIKYYGDGASNDSNLGVIASTQRVMLQRVPNYNDVTVDSTKNFTPSAWNGVKGGVMFFRASGAVSVNGTIHASELGYRGGSAYLLYSGGDGGEAFCGAGGTGSTAGGNGSAGGGGTTGGGTGYCGGGGGADSGGVGSSSAGGAGGGGGGRNGGGAGGGYGTGGEGGLGYDDVRASSGGTNSSGNGSSYSNGGAGGGGGSYGDSELGKIFLGSGGGGGGASTDYIGGAGGTGGGIVILESLNIAISGSVTSKGEAGENSLRAGGGGASGGSIKLTAKNINIGSSFVDVSGGIAGLGTGTYGRSGGAGGDGRIAVYYADSYSGTSGNPSVTNYYQPGYNSYGIYNSPVIPTPNAQTYGDMRWDKSQEGVVLSGGSLDTSFGSGVEGGGNVNAIVLQSDGKILIGGEGIIARLNSNGSLDTSFGSGLQVGGSVLSMALQSDGKILIGGPFTTYGGVTRQYVARLNSNGSLDTSFDSSSGANGEVPTIAIQDDGKILIGGSFTTYGGVTRQCVARLNSNGSLDTSFDSSSGAYGSVYVIVPQSVNKIIVGGYFSLDDWVTEQSLARFNSKAILDPYDNISVQTRSGNSTDSTDGTWEEWKPFESPINYTMLESADTHTNWTGTNATVAEGDVSRDVDFFEDEDESMGNGNIVEIDSYGIENDNANYTVNEDKSYGQSFTAGYGILDSVELKLKRFGSPTGNAYVKVYQHSGTYGTSSVGTGTVLAISDPIDVTSISTSYSVISFDFSGANRITLSDTYYVFHFGLEDYNTGTNGIQIAIDQTSPSHDGNQIFVSNSGIQTAISSQDLIFYVNVEGSNITKMTSSTNGGYIEATISSTDLNNYDYITAWVRASQTGNTLRLSIGEIAGDEEYEDITIDASNTWQKIYWDISDIVSSDKNGITKLRLTNLSSSSNTIYLDNIRGEKLLTNNEGSEITSTPNNYLQYRVVFTTTNLSYCPRLENISFLYGGDYRVVIHDGNNVRLYNYTGQTQYLKLTVISQKYGTGADLAELYPSKQTLRAGEVVSIDTDNEGYIKRSTTSYDSNLLGVISTNPGMVLGKGETYSDKVYELALKGRVPVLVDPYSDDIKIGDPVTSSALKGYAKKATQSGSIVGYALESWSKENGKDTVMIFVSTEKYQKRDTQVLGMNNGLISFGFNSYGSTRLLSSDKVEQLFLDSNGRLYVTNVATIKKSSIGLINNSEVPVQQKDLVKLDTNSENGFKLASNFNEEGIYAVVKGVDTNGDVNKNGVCDSGDSCILNFNGLVDVNIEQGSEALVDDYIYSSSEPGKAIASSEEIEGANRIGVLVSDITKDQGYVKILFNAESQKFVDRYIGIGTNKGWYTQMYNQMSQEYEKLSLAQRRGEIESNNNEYLLFDNSIDDLKTNIEISNTEIYNSRKFVFKDTNSGATMWVSTTNTVEQLPVYVSNDGGVEYTEGTLIKTYKQEGTNEYEFSFDFNTSDNEYIVKIGLNGENVSFNKWILAPHDCIYSKLNGYLEVQKENINSGEFLEILHKQDTYNLLTRGWYLNNEIGTWENIVDNNNLKINIVNSNSVRLINNTQQRQDMKLMIIFETILDSPQSNKYVMSLSPSVAQIDQVSDSNSLWVNKLYNNGNLLSLQTQNNNMFVVNSQGSLTMNGDIEVLGGNISLGSGGNIRYNETTKAIEFSNDKQTWVQLGALKSKTILSAEYPGAVFASDGNNNFGNMTAGSEGVVNNSMNYYQWSSSDISLNDYDIRVRFKIPEDFETWGEGYIRLNYVTQSNDVNFNKVDLYMFKQGSDIVDGFSENLVSKEGGKWSSIDIFGSQLKECVNPGDVCMFVIKMSSSNGNYTRVGDIEIEYNRNL